MTSDLNHSENITDEGLKHLTNMRSGLNLWRCDKITDKGLKYLTNMRSGLDLSYC